MCGHLIFPFIVDGNNIIELKVAAKKNIDISGANPPVLSENMLPVYYDEEAEVWKKASEPNKDEEYKWYDYDNKIWANSVTVTETSRASYKNANPGTVISMDDILTMQVWIPRYKYRIFNYNENGTSYSTPQQIEILFESGESNTGEVSCVDSVSGTNGAVSETCKLKSTNETCTDSLCNAKTYTHPAFTFGNQELTGFWMGKFEPVSDISCTPADSDSPVGSGCNLNEIRPLIKPDMTSWRSAHLGTLENNMLAMNDSGNKYGFLTADDTHMAKTMDWGAVAYLSHSKYGLCTDGVCQELKINNSSGYYTGRSGGGPGGSTPINGTYSGKTSTTQYNTYGFYTYDGYLLEYNTNTKSTTRDMSKIASTNGNVTGVYDMSGGACEYVMGVIVSNNGSTMMTGYNSTNNSRYSGIVYNSGNYTTYSGLTFPEEKYYTKYSFGTSDSQKKRSKLGDGIKEVATSSTAGWYSDHGYVGYSVYPWFNKSGAYDLGATAGLFRANNHQGDTTAQQSARFVLTIPLTN